LLVEPGADQIDMAGLILTQEIASAAQFKITRGDFET
jgi:hypothetical protein